MTSYFRSGDLGQNPGEIPQPKPVTIIRMQKIPHAATTNLRQSTIRRRRKMTNKEMAPTTRMEVGLRNLRIATMTGTPGVEKGTKILSTTAQHILVVISRYD